MTDLPTRTLGPWRIEVALTDSRCTSSRPSRLKCAQYKLKCYRNGVHIPLWSTGSIFGLENAENAMYILTEESLENWLRIEMQEAQYKIDMFKRALGAQEK